MKLILIEEDRMWREIYKRLFNQLAVEHIIIESRFKAVSAVIAAIDHWKVNPDLVLLDIIIDSDDPTGTIGILLLKELKSNPVTAPIPVAIISADYSERGKTEALQEGAVAYLNKLPGAVIRLLGQMGDQ